MANLKVNAEFDTAMEQLTPETRAHADRFNERYEQLLGNDAFLKGKIEDANTNIERAMAVAQGKSAGYVFNTYSELIAYIAVPANVEKFRLGDQFLIKATDVPDYWWDNTVTTAQTDSAGNVISGKNTSGKIVGALVELEARKIDLSKYDANDAALFNNMSDQYSSARAYDVGDICIHNNDLYKCVTAVEAAETFNASKWNKTSLAALHAEQEKKISENTQSLTDKANALVQKLHPVGSWYFSTVATNPVNIFGFGTWQLVTDRFLVGAGASYFPGAMGGEAVHTLTAAELPTHQHNVLSGTLGGNNGNYKFMLSPQSMYGTYDGQYGVITDDRFITAASSAYCGNQPHNNMPPYYAIYMWVRTA